MVIGDWLGAAGLPACYREAWTARGIGGGLRFPEGGAGDGVCMHEGKRQWIPMNLSPRRDAGRVPGARDGE